VLVAAVEVGLGGEEAVDASCSAAVAVREVGRNLCTYPCCVGFGGPPVGRNTKNQSKALNQQESHYLVHLTVHVMSHWHLLIIHVIVMAHLLERRRAIVAHHSQATVTDRSL
jgi:hypothetical protein